VKQKVLLIDDDPKILLLQKTYLEIEGFDVAHFDGASLDALNDILNRDRPDIILMDVNLRHINGFTLLRNIRQSESYKSIPIVMTSGMDMGLRCQQEGANAFLLKPYMPDELTRLLRSFLAA
jgi:CheY-like chemotaxis protein